MKKKVNSVLAVLVLAGFAVFLTAEGAKAFCVYNKTDKKIKVTQTDGGYYPYGIKGFSATLQPGESGCCSWENRDCNGAGNKDSNVAFTVQLHSGGLWHHVCSDFRIQAAGALTVEGYGDHKCVRHDYGPPPPAPIVPLQ